MKARGGLAILVCAVAASLALPASAVAKPGYVVDKAMRISVVELPESRGYSVSVVGVNSKLVGISVYDFRFSKGATSTASASYIVRGRVTDERIEGRFGSRGYISVRFEPEGKPETESFPSTCKGDSSTWQDGRWTGTIRFEGENGFARARATTAKGFVIRKPRAICKRRSGNKDQTAPKAPPGTSLSAVSSHYPRAPWFSVFEEESSRLPAPFAEYSANTIEKRQGIRIHRWVNATTSPDTFEVAPLGSRPVTATVEPPAPFRGTALYEKKPGGEVSWSGDLAVELPGRGVLPLADSTYRAELCRSLACACPVGNCAFVSVGAGSSQAERLRRLTTGLRP
jgi:hypothetical protein